MAPRCVAGRCQSVGPLPGGTRGGGWGGGCAEMATAAATGGNAIQSPPPRWMEGARAGERAERHPIARWVRRSAVRRAGEHVRA